MDSTIVLIRHWYNSLDHSYVLFFTISAVLFPPLILWFKTWLRDIDGPPTLRDVVPFITNTYQYMTNQTKFIERVSLITRAHGIAKAYLGPMPIYILTGAESVQSMFRVSREVGSDIFLLRIMKYGHWFTNEDLAKFANDKSGRLKVPAHGTTPVPENERYWATRSKLYHEYLLQKEPCLKLVDSFYEKFQAKLEEQPLGEWATVRLYEYLKYDMAEAATVALAGTKLLEVNPNFLDGLWALDEIALRLIWGLPGWLDPKPARVREQFNKMGQKYLESAFASFDWSSPAADADWEPIFGARFTREHDRWAKEAGLSLRTRGGLFVFHLFGLNANTIPIIAWAIIELIKDPALFQELRAEIQEAVRPNPATGKTEFDAQKLLGLPLLQSIYVECMRLHVSINITREIKEPITVGGYRLSSGLLQAPTSISHFNEDVWAREGHSATEFWAHRHIKTIRKTDNDGNEIISREFSMAGKSAQFFPYGGGTPICPGRNFAKQEIMLTVAMLITKFDIQFVEWVNHDGSKSDRGPLDNENYCGAASVPPDRDMKIRWKRLS